MRVPLSSVCVFGLGQELRVCRETVVRLDTLIPERSQQVTLSAGQLRSGEAAALTLCLPQMRD